jgi:hypothetical protein
LEEFLLVEQEFLWMADYYHLVGDCYLVDFPWLSTREPRLLWLDILKTDYLFMALIKTKINSEVAANKIILPSILLCRFTE